MQITQIAQIGECQFNHTIEDFRRYQARPFSPKNGLMWPQEIAECHQQLEIGPKAAG
ncbi:hypothetical protein [Ferrovum sp.]|jgi:hypothetical protein|uniref:hypothetical protein n=1 Tax=Ferrovum sp. TaxID=2609467 RepID=UPI00261E9EED|nr:hypothetical protein [Ferrovum sp.]